MNEQDKQKADQKNRPQNRPMNDSKDCNDQKPNHAETGKSDSKHDKNAKPQQTPRAVPKIDLKHDKDAKPQLKR